MFTVKISDADRNKNTETQRALSGKHRTYCSKSVSVCFPAPNPASRGSRSARSPAYFSAFFAAFASSFAAQVDQTQTVLGTVNDGVRKRGGVSRIAGVSFFLCKNPTAINWGYYAMSEDDLSQALHQLKSFDRPDMYAILKDKISIIEHFEFDASVCSRKGMKGIKEERLLDHHISSAPIGDEFHVGKAIQCNFSAKLQVPA